MRIGILTLPFHTNYGGILQAFALNQILEKSGHQVTFICINQEIHLRWYKQWLKYLLRIVKKYILRKNRVDMLWEKHHNEYIQRQKEWSKYTSRFVLQHLHCHEYSSFRDIQITDFEAIIVGSDQIWRKKYVPVIETSFLSFAKDWNIKRIAYAPSFGTDEWEYNEKETNHCRQLIQLFDSVSVREEEGVTLIKEHLGREAKCTLDPTLLLTKEDYIKKVSLTKVPRSKGNLLCYFIDMNEEKQNLIDRIAKERNLVPFTVNSKAEDTNAKPTSADECIQPPVENWLRGFYDAEFIVTDSFHACAFAIIFGKQFVVYGNENRGLSRYHSLLDKFGLENRIITKTENIVTPEDYCIPDVLEILEKEKKQSNNFLFSALQ